jgi:UbiD family decarboxylase
MPGPDLRSWLAAVEALGELVRLPGADPELEIGAIAEWNYRQRGPALLFEAMPGYGPEMRLLVGAASGPRRLGLTLNLGADHDHRSLTAALRGKPQQWERQALPPREVRDGPVMEVVEEGEAVDLTRFPAPLWHPGDGGRYLGTGTAAITVDPDGGWVNLGADRCMVVDKNRMTVLSVPGKHGRLQMDAWFRRQGRAPVAVSLGHHPLLHLVAGTEVPTGLSEYAYAGAILGEPVDVIRAPITGLPIPAAAELVVEGFVYPDRAAPEGPFGEWTGYYSGSEKPVPTLEVAAVYRRRDPIVLGAPPGLPPHDFTYWRAALKSAMIHDALVEAGVPEVRGVWAHESGGGRQLVVVSIATRFCGHARQAGILASQLRAGAYMGKYVIVVDDDIDPTDLEQVMWAVCTRSDPAQDIEIIRKAWGSQADPLLTDPRAPYNTRAIIDATIPYERKGSFPAIARSDPALAERVRAKWEPWLRRRGKGEE